MHDARRQRVILAVQDHGQPRRTGIEHAVPEDACRSRSQAVVGDAEGSRLLEEAHLRQPLASEPDVEGRRNTRPHPRLPLHATDQSAYHDRAVNDGIRVRHHDDAREASCCCSGRATLDIFLILAPRRTPVGVDVDEAGNRCRPSASSSRGPRRPSPTSAIRPDERRTSMSPSSPEAGSSTWA